MFWVFHIVLIEMTISYVTTILNVGDGREGGDGRDPVGGDEVIERNRK